MSDQASAPTPGDQVYAAFTEIYTQEWQWRIDQLGDPSMASVDQPLDPRLPDVTPQAQQARLERWQRDLDQLAQLDLDQLDAGQCADVEVYRSQLQTLAGQQQFRMYERPANADSAFWMQLTAQSRRRLTTAEEAETYLQWLRQIPVHVDQNIANMRAGVSRGFGPAQISMTGRDATIRTVAEAASASDVSTADHPAGISR